VAAAAIAAVCCGQASGVVGGNPVPIQSAPWAVAIVDRLAPNTRALCSGSIIDRTHILTAAHCLYHPDGAAREPGELIVKAGASNYLTAEPGDNEQDRYVGSFRIHPGFKAENPPRLGAVTPDDVAVLEVTEPLDLGGPTTRAVRVESAPAPSPTGVATMVAGFGVQSLTEIASGALRGLDLKVEAQGRCGLPVMSLFNGIERCAQSPTGSVCYGDSGAGLVTTGPDPRLLGILIGALPGCEPGSYSVSTYVGAPEIGGFLGGSNHPPTAPRGFIELTAGNPPHIGESINCKTRSPNRNTRFRYTFTTSQGRLLQSGSRTTYVIKPAAAGTEIICLGAATNAGGTTLSELRTRRVKRG
jgi:hypothetical protein